MIQAITVFLILMFIIFFIIFVKIGNKVINELEKKTQTSYTENEL
jgi:large-conductance mechanosensitive channel